MDLWTGRERLDLLSRAWKWSLMTGGLFGAHALQGWIEQCQGAVRLSNGQLDFTAAGERLWSAHGDALLAEAFHYGFEPFWVNGRRPTGAGFDRWRRAFLEENKR